MTTRTLKGKENMQGVHLEPASVDSMMISFDLNAGELTSRKIIRCLDLITQRLGALIIDAIPGWNTLLLQYVYQRISYGDLEARIRVILSEWDSLESAESASTTSTTDLHVLPVYYDGEDLETVAKASGLSIPEVIRLHVEGDYFVGAVGFVPGFGYLGGLAQALVLPRRSSPRVIVPKGSVAIAEAQTCIYPEALPGGWNLLGRCPLRMYDIQRTPPGRFKVGDKIKFKEIDEGQYHQLEGKWDWDPAVNGAASQCQ